MPSKGATRQLGSRIAEDLHTRVKIFCLKKQTTLEDFVAEAIKEKLDRDEGIAKPASLSDTVSTATVRPFRRKNLPR